MAYGTPALIAIWTDVMISAALTPNAVKPRMRSLLVSTKAFRNPRVSESVLARITAPHRNFEQAVGSALCFRFLLTESAAGEFRICEQAEWNLSARGHAFAAGDAVIDHAKVVSAHVSELRAACYLTDRQTPGALVSRCSSTLMYPPSVSSIAILFEQNSH